MLCGLLGKKLSHSYSPQIHKHLGDYSYDLFEKQPEEVGEFLKNGAYSGINVTIPYKKDVIPYCEELTDCARALGAVNTIVRRSDGTLAGHNTDYFGFQYMVNKSRLTVANKKVLVLGSGGASATAVAVLQNMGANIVVISRSGVNNYDNICFHSDAAIIVNTTPVGMYPNAGASPVDLDLFPNLEGVLDIIYNPARTKLLMDAEKRGIVAENGLSMLVAQAKEAAEWFTGNKISNSVIEKIYTTLRKEMENIVLIGMPGCGKSTVGRRIAERTGKQFVDVDTEIASFAGMSIPEIFAREGEEGFRRRETDILTQLGQRSGLVIATGGGCVTRKENYPLLHQNGTIYWLQRDIGDLPTDGRPLSQTEKKEQMWQIRKPLYSGFADYAIDNNNQPEIAAEEITRGYLL